MRLLGLASAFMQIVYQIILLMKEAVFMGLKRYRDCLALNYLTKRKVI
jgi:hypothetical protein